MDLDVSGFRVGPVGMEGTKAAPPPSLPSEPRPLAGDPDSAKDDKFLFVAAEAVLFAPADAGSKRA